MKVNIDVAGSLFVIGIFTLIVLFVGEPDLHAALMQWLARCN